MCQIFLSQQDHLSLKRLKKFIVIEFFKCFLFAYALKEPLTYWCVFKDFHLVLLIYQLMKMYSFLNSFILQDLHSQIFQLIHLLLRSQAHFLQISLNFDMFRSVLPLLYPVIIFIFIFAWALLSYCSLKLSVLKILQAKCQYSFVYNTCLKL